LFDAIELTVFSNKIFNFNKKTRAVAEKYNKPLVATSDTHFLKDLERGYALIDANQKTPEATFEAIKKRSFKNQLSPMSPLAMLEFRIKGILRKILHKCYISL
jgi:predicted metal-dependent phosphoesterase TrpH